MLHGLGTTLLRQPTHLAARLRTRHRATLPGNMKEGQGSAEKVVIGCRAATTSETQGVSHIEAQWRSRPGAWEVSGPYLIDGDAGAIYRAVVELDASPGTSKAKMSAMEACAGGSPDWIHRETCLRP